MKKFARFFDSFLVPVLLVVIGYAISHAQPPSWLVPVSSSSAVLPPVVGRGNADPQGGNAEVIRARVITKVKHDTITVVKTDTVVKIDTLFPSKSFYNYTVYYEIVSKQVSSSKSFLWDFSTAAQKTTLQSSDTTLLSLGSETLREASFSYDKEGNKTQTYEKIIEGLDMRVNGRNASISYRTGENLLLLNGKFDNNGLLILSSDFSEHRYFLYFVPLDWIFGAKKYTLFLRVEKTGVY